MVVLHARQKTVKCVNCAIHLLLFFVVHVIGCCVDTDVPHVIKELYGFGGGEGEREMGGERKKALVKGWQA